MSDIKIKPSATGSATVTLTAPATGTARTVTLPDSTDTLAVNSDVTNKLPLAGGTMTGTIAGFTSTGIDDNADATAMTITSDEKIGIGTVSPAGALQVVGATSLNNAALHVKGTKSTTNDLIPSFTVESATTGTAANGVGTSMTFFGSMSGQDNIQLGEIGFHNNNVSGAHGDFVVRTRPNGTVAERLRITSDGRGLSQFTAKAWINFNGTGTIAVKDSHNVSSIIDHEAGQIRVQFANNMANANYSAIVSGWVSYNGATGVFDKSTSEFKAVTANGSSYTDAADTNVLVFGD